MNSFPPNQLVDIDDLKRKTEWKRGFTQSLIALLLATFMVVTPMVPTKPVYANAHNSIAAGIFHSIFLGPGGQVYSWGQSSYGQLGLGETNDRTSPVAISRANFPDSPTITALSAGNNHAIALSSDGKLYSWGQSSYGQLGIDDTNEKTSPVAVSTAHLAENLTFSAIAAGSSHSIALGSDGNLYSWGRNTKGQLGTDDVENKFLPVAVSTAHLAENLTFSAIAAGGSHSVALGSDGNLYSWGWNSSGQLGTGGNTDTSIPVAVSTGEVQANSTFSAISATGNNSMAIASDGNLYSWGANSRGQLGVGDNEPKSSPAAVDLPGNLTVIAVTAGYEFSMAIASDGKLYSWGSNSSGALGIGVLSFINGVYTNTNKNSPVAVSTASFPANLTFSAIGAGAYHSIALAADGDLYSWGNNQKGQLGVGDNATKSSPAQVLLPLLIPTFASPTATSDGFTVQISNYDANYTWTGVATASGSVAISSTGLITVTGVAAGINSTATITAARNEYGTGSSTVAGSSLNSAPADSAPAPYSGPLPTSVSKKSVSSGQAITITGQRLRGIISVKIDGFLAVISNRKETALTITIPLGLEAGLKDLAMISNYGNLTYQDAIEIIQTPEDYSVADEPLEDNLAPSSGANPTSSQKLNAGSFKGYVAIYAKGYEGKILSAKVAGKWLKINSLGSNFERILLPTGAGYEIKIDLYIDAVLLEQMEVTTR